MYVYVRMCIHGAALLCRKLPATGDFSQNKTELQRRCTHGGCNRLIVNTKI